MLLFVVETITAPFLYWFLVVDVTTDYESDLASRIRESRRQLGELRSGDIICIVLALKENDRANDVMSKRKISKVSSFGSV